jgi:hypothetical protein
MRLEIGGYVGARERCMLSVWVVCLWTIFLFSSTFFFFFFEYIGLEFDRWYR